MKKVNQLVGFDVDGLMLSEVIARLSEALEKYGDCQFSVSDYGGGVSITFERDETSEEHAERMRYETRLWKAKVLREDIQKATGRNLVNISTAIDDWERNRLPNVD